jgi:hypothetical protein
VRGLEDIKVTDIAYDTKAETAKLSLAKELPGAGKAVLELKFSGAINHKVVILFLLYCPHPLRGMVLIWVGLDGGVLS